MPTAEGACCGGAGASAHGEGQAGPELSAESLSWNRWWGVGGAAPEQCGHVCGSESLAPGVCKNGEQHTPQIAQPVQRPQHIVLLHWKCSPEPSPARRACGSACMGLLRPMSASAPWGHPWQKILREPALRVGPHPGPLHQPTCSPASAACFVATVSMHPVELVARLENAPARNFALMPTSARSTRDPPRSASPHNFASEAPILARIRAVSAHVQPTNPHDPRSPQSRPPTHRHNKTTKWSPGGALAACPPIDTCAPRGLPKVKPISRSTNIFWGKMAPRGERRTSMMFAISDHCRPPSLVGASPVPTRLAVEDGGLR